MRQVLPAMLPLMRMCEVFWLAWRERFLRGSWLLLRWGLERGVISRGIREVDQETAWLLPPSVQNWLPEDHLARFVVEIIDSLDPGRLISAYPHGGKRVYHPGMLLALLPSSVSGFPARRCERVRALPRP